MRVIQSKQTMSQGHRYLISINGIDRVFVFIQKLPPVEVGVGVRD